MNLLTSIKALPPVAKVGLGVVGIGVVYYIVKGRGSGGVSTISTPTNAGNESMAGGYAPDMAWPVASGGTGGAAFIPASVASASSAGVGDIAAATPTPAKVAAPVKAAATVAQRELGHIKQFGGSQEYVAEIQRKEKAGIALSDPQAATAMKAQNPNLFKVGLSHPITQRVAGHVKYFGGETQYAAAIKSKEKSKTPLDDPVAAAYFEGSHPNLFKTATVAKKPIIKKK